MQNVQEKMQAITAAQNAFATIESIRPGAIPHETKVLLAELKVDLMDIQDDHAVRWFATKPFEQ